MRRATPNGPVLDGSLVIELIGGRLAYIVAPEVNDEPSGIEVLPAENLNAFRWSSPPLRKVDSFPTDAPLHQWLGSKPKSVIVGYQLSVHCEAGTLTFSPDLWLPQGVILTVDVTSPGSYH